jgi:diphthine synthase
MPEALLYSTHITSSIPHNPHLNSMLYVIGLGLGSEKDITVRGLEAVKSCERVYLESYTSVLLSTPHADLEAFYGKEVIVADREMVESESDRILDGASTVNVAFLVVGDPYGYVIFFLRALWAPD